MSFCDELMQDFRKMLDFRKSVGYATATYISSVTPFIEYCGTHYPEADCLTKEMVDGWLRYYPYKTDNTRSAFISLLRQYAKFINALGKKGFIPDEDYTIPRQPYVPYVFTDGELLTLFDAIDSIPRCRVKKFRRDLVLPAMFRMMYCCGMRPSEPLHLRSEDVDLVTGDVYIRQSKRHKDRHIILSDDMRMLCNTYYALSEGGDWFFQRSDGKPYTTDWMTAQFHLCWKRSNLEKRGNPRPYDLRHAFATRNLMRWIDEGSDVMTLLPYLSTYMGHSELNSTLYYVHLLPERIRKSAGIDWELFSSIYKQGGQSDED